MSGLLSRKKQTMFRTLNLKFWQNSNACNVNRKHTILLYKQDRQLKDYSNKKLWLARLREIPLPRLRLISRLSERLQTLLITTNELRVLVGELGPKLTEIVNKSNTQLKLEGHCSLSSSDSNAKPKVVAISSNLKLALPTFDGDVLNWREFWSLFSDVLSKDRGLTDTEKCCHLINSMSTPEAKEQAKSAVAYTTLLCRGY